MVDPAGRPAFTRRQGAHDPDPDARRREAEQDRALGAQAPRRALPRAEIRRDRGRCRPSARRGGADPPQRADAGLAPEAGRRRGRRRVRALPRRQRSAAGGRRRRQFPLTRAHRVPRDPDLARANRARAPLRARRKGAGDVGRNRRDLHREPGAHPANREELHGEAERPHRNEERLRRGLRTREGIAWANVLLLDLADRLGAPSGPGN